MLSNGFVLCCNTIDMENFAGLNIHGFTPMKFLQKYFYIFLARSADYLGEALIFMEKLAMLLKTVKV